MRQGRGDCHIVDGCRTRRANRDAERALSESRDAARGRILRIDELHLRIVRDASCVETSRFPFAAPTPGLLGPVMVGIRPEDVRLRSTATGTSGEVTGRTLNQTFFGDYQLCRVQAGGESLVVKIGIDVRADLRDHDIWLEFPPEKLHIFPARAG